MFSFYHTHWIRTPQKHLCHCSGLWLDERERERGREKNRTKEQQALIISVYLSSRGSEVDWLHVSFSDAFLFLTCVTFGQDRWWDIRSVLVCLDPSLQEQTVPWPRTGRKLLSSIASEARSVNLIVRRTACWWRPFELGLLLFLNKRNASNPYLTFLTGKMLDRNEMKEDLM